MKTTLLLLLTTFTFCFAETKFFPPQVDDQQYDISKWTKVPLTFENGIDKETIELSFPAKPQKNSKGEYVVTDPEGMTFQVYALADSDLGPEPFSVQEGVDFLIKTLENSPKVRLLYKEPSSDPQNRSSSVAWVLENGRLTRLTVVKGKQFTFFIQTEVTNPAFFNKENVQPDTPAYEQLKNDSYKNQAFVRSLILSN